MHWPAKIFHGRKRCLARCIGAVGVALMAVWLGACGKSNTTQLASQADEEIRLEAQVEKLLSELNSRHREIAALASANSRILTPELRDKAAAARHATYVEEEYLQTLDRARKMVEDKISGLAAEKAAFQNQRETDAPITNTPPPTLAPTNAVPNERTEEDNLKIRLVEARAETEEMRLLMSSAAKLPEDAQQKAASADSESYASERYRDILKSTRELLEKKLAGLDAEAEFYEKLSKANAENKAKPVQ